MNTRQLVWTAILSVALLPQALWGAVQCKAGLKLVASNATTNYTISGATVTDLRTNLMWKRCSEGQSWDPVGQSCTGLATLVTWPSALAAGANSTFSGMSGWRLPNIKELTSLVEWCVDAPALNTEAFPGAMTRGAYWSSSPTRDIYQHTTLAWTLESQNGGYLQVNRASTEYVRLVRDAPFVAMPALSAGLNDTGITTCGDATSTNALNCASVAGDGGAFPRQDARYGRDAQAGDGQLASAFNFTTVSNGDCVLDNVTGLTWEVKTTSGLRNYLYTYTRYDGSVGTPSGGTNCASAGHCDTYSFVNDVKATSLCGYSDWRLPTVKELQNIVNFGLWPGFDATYFPNTVANAYWTATASANNPTLQAWVVNFLTGAAQALSNSSSISVRLVRGQP